MDDDDDRHGPYDGHGPEVWGRLLAGAAADRAAQPGRICALCVALLGVTGAGISMIATPERRGVVHATDDVAALVECLQLTLGPGPGLDALRGGSPVLVADLNDPADVAVERWSAFIEGASATGVQALFAFPLRIGAISVGVLSLYRDRPGELGDRQLRAALMAADAAAVALLHLDLDGDRAFGDDPQARASFQLQVHQATGMVQVQLGIKTDEAFLVLRARAFAMGRPLAEVATDVVQRRLRFSTEDL